MVALIGNPLQAKAMGFVYVDVSKQIYSYDEMVEDIISISAGHEDFVCYSTLTTTSQGRSVCLLKFGNLASDNKILITASIHAREYMTSQLVMRMLEEYILNYDVPQANGLTYRQMFDSVCFYVLPMINPDGVTISQFGGTPRIKSNGNGVDLNRNFPLGFGQAPNAAKKPSLSNYPGPTPLSEVETLVMATLLNENDFVTCINYHSMGELIYYGASTNSAEVAIGCKNMANLVGSITGYKKLYCGNAIGSFADYFGSVEAAPSVTIEIGTATPTPISQFDEIYNRNINVWPEVARLYQ